jgi:hypothetical protein
LALNWRDDMTEQPFTPDQEAEIEALVTELGQQAVRVGVDMEHALPRLHAPTPPVERRISDEELEVTFSMDVSSILETLRGLPDGAGTAAFVAAHEGRARDAHPRDAHHG